METFNNEFSNEDITVTYEPKLCIHAEKCAKELSEVFSNCIIPWINLDGVETSKIINQIKKCPSGALKYHKRINKQAS
ncbi:divergent 4Fe-4S mono-cluster [Tamlana nanhaiensis]|uniref:Divergent 4Fe-4S mono-cluster n=1 Tax=Neotamlana nanhaiensis TaxID=1382798 RepID=A0A0D7W308_9FLAO|nr:(4Fe-4S)-binding protein [Tamlana nanhaiensis]KJD33476.1 divergent 4Fe-4S mono-cluster [Tamlana nanhaiensis]